MWPFMIGIAFSELSRVGAYGSAPFLFVTTLFHWASQVAQS